MRKRLQQQHNEAAQKRITSVITFLVVLLFVIGGSLQVQAQDTNTNGTHIAGIESLTGCSEEEVRAAKFKDNTFPEDDKNKIFFLYNVKTGLLLNAGGYCLFERIRNAAMDTYRQKRLDSPCPGV